MRWAMMLGVVCLLGFCACSREDSASAQAVVSTDPAKTESKCPMPYSQVAPPWSATDLDGKPVSLADYKGKKGVLLVFFATWCSYCMQEVPDLIKFQDQVKDKPISVVGMAIEQPARLIRKFQADRKVNYTLALDAEGATAQAYNVRGIPTICGINRDGCVVFYGHALPADTAALARVLEGSGPNAEALKP